MEDGAGKRMKHFFFASVVLLLIFLAGSGCKKASVTQQPPLPVNVVTAIEKEVREWDEFTRRLDPVESVEIRPRVSRGKILRLILAAQATVVWSTDGGARSNLLDTIYESRLNLWFADFPTGDWPVGSMLTFTFFWKRDQRWEGRDWQVNVL